MQHVYTILSPETQNLLSALDIRKLNIQMFCLNYSGYISDSNKVKIRELINLINTITNQYYSEEHLVQKINFINEELTKIESDIEADIKTIKKCNNICLVVIIMVTTLIFGYINAF